MLLSCANYRRYAGGMRNTSVRLSDDLWQQWKTSRVPLREVIRAGLVAISGGTPAPGAAPVGGTAPEPAADLAVSGDWITVQEAGAALGISVSGVHHLLSVGYLASRKADDGWRREVSAESVRAELARRKRVRQGTQAPYADAASTYQAETEAAYRAAVARYTPEEVTRDDPA